MDDSYKNKSDEVEDEIDKTQKPEDDAFEKLQQASNRDDAAVSVNNNSWKRLKGDIDFINNIRVSDKEKIVSEFVSLHNIFDLIKKDVECLRKEGKDYETKGEAETKNLFNFLLKKEKRIDKFISKINKDLFWSKYVTNLFVIYCENVIRHHDVDMNEPFRHICDKDTLTKLTMQTPRKAQGVLIPMVLSRFKKYHFLRDLFTGSIMIKLLLTKDFFSDINKDVNKYVDSETGFFKIDSNPMIGLNKFRKEIVEILRTIKKNNPPEDALESKTSEDEAKSGESLEEFDMKNFNINKHVFGHESNVIDFRSPSIMSSESFSTLAKASNIDVKNKTITQPIFFMDEISRNNSKYDGQSVVKAIFGNKFVMEKLKNGILQGEMEHPDPKKGVERFMTIDPENVSHVFKNLEIKDGNRIDGTMRFVKPKGDIIWDWIEAGANMAFSIRIYTPNYKVVRNANGQEYTEKFGEMQFVTFDCVRMPGFYYARMTNPDQYDNREISKEDVDRFNADMKKSIESDRVYYESVMTNKEVENLLTSQEHFSFFQDRFGIDLKTSKIEYLENGFVNILTGPSRRIQIPVDTHNVNRILVSKNRF